VERSGRAVLGEAGVGATRQSTGGEDFAWYLDHAPGAYFRLGVRTPGGPTVDIHAGNFDADETAVALGARVLAGTALEALAALS
jgi:amidohydrolase